MYNLTITKPYGNDVEAIVVKFFNLNSEDALLKIREYVSQGYNVSAVNNVEDGTITVKEAAKIKGVTTATIYNHRDKFNWIDKRIEKDELFEIWSKDLRGRK